ncbi:uncharacterized protein LOC142639986 [Castanea sativa]|uniref:uncharacterized protein LOC142639986 n=1 Tax=Castanea sativa TaxID=21020 RepID=UPI003F654276
MFNEIDGNFDDVAIRTFKVGLLAEHDLRKSLTRKPVRSVRQLMDHIDEYKQVEKDQRWLRKLKQFLYQPNGQGGQAGSRARKDALIGPPLGIISVILAASGRTGSQPSNVMFVARLSTEGSSYDLKRSRVEGRPTLSFSDEDKVGTLQPYDDALVVTLG